MRQEMMTIIKQEEIAPRIFEMTLKGDLVQEMGESGQFIHIRVPRQDLLLRRPISLNRIHRELGTCRIIYRVEGDGTRIFSEMTAGDVLDVMGPLGRGFDLSQLQAGDQAFIIGGGSEFLHSMNYRPSSAKKGSTATISSAMRPRTWSTMKRPLAN